MWPYFQSYNPIMRGGKNVMEFEFMMITKVDWLLTIFLLILQNTSLSRNRIQLSQEWYCMIVYDGTGSTDCKLKLRYFHVFKHDILH